MTSVRIQTEDFDVSTELAQLRIRHPNIGAIVNFVGVVRDLHESGGLNEMTLEHYPGMTEKVLHDLIEKACSRWNVIDIQIIHRIGSLTLSDQIVCVVVASTHRQDAFSACAFIMDHLKTTAPFWKKEHTSNGTHWVHAKTTDDLALKKWKEPS